MILCGVRDVQDYRIRSGSTSEVISGGSAFNIWAESLRLGDFREVKDLLAQHTTETSQTFTEQALSAVLIWTCCQPWSVNALCLKACFGNETGRDRTQRIGFDDMLGAREHLVSGREIHLDQLADKLEENRVRRMIKPMLSSAEAQSFTAQDLAYVRDLGLVVRDAPLRIANPIYTEVIPRDLTSVAQERLTRETAWYVEDGSLDVDRLLDTFQRFFREHSEHLVHRFDYRETWPQLLLQAFLQRVINGGGRIEQEYALLD